MEEGTKLEADAKTLFEKLSDVFVQKQEEVKQKVDE